MCNTINYYKEDLLGKNIDVLMPDSLRFYHNRIICEYSEIFSVDKAKKLKLDV